MGEKPWIGLFSEQVLGLICHLSQEQLWSDALPDTTNEPDGIWSSNPWPIDHEPQALSTEPRLLGMHSQIHSLIAKLLYFATSKDSNSEKFDDLQGGAHFYFHLQFYSNFTPRQFGKITCILSTVGSRDKTSKTKCHRPIQKVFPDPKHSKYKRRCTSYIGVVSMVFSTNTWW